MKKSKLTLSLIFMIVFTITILGVNAESIFINFENNTYNGFVIYNNTRDGNCVGLAKFDHALFNISSNSLFGDFTLDDYFKQFTYNEISLAIKEYGGGASGETCDMTHSLNKSITITQNSNVNISFSYIYNTNNNYVTELYIFNLSNPIQKILVSNLTESLNSTNISIIFNNVTSGTRTLEIYSINKNDFGSAYTKVYYGFDNINISITPLFINTTTNTNNLSILLNLTFDNSSNYLKDYSNYHHTFINTSDVKYGDKNICKWYNCILFNETTGQYIRNDSLSNNTINEGFGMEWWAYHVNAPSSSYSSGYLWIRNLTNYPYGDKILSGEDNTGWNIRIRNSSGDLSSQYYDYASPTTKGWHYYGFWYNNSDCIWHFILDGNEKNRTSCIGNISNINNSLIELGRSRYWDSGNMYLDEFIFYNSINKLNTQYFINSYNSKRYGTPPELDIYVDSIKYQIPYNFSAPNNTINLNSNNGNLSINITLKNSGLNNSGFFNYSIYIDDLLIKKEEISINGQSKEIIYFNITKELGWHYGSINVDYQDEDLSNNNQSIQIPLFNRPYMHFNLTQMNEVYNPYCDVTNSTVVSDLCTWIDSYNINAFNNGWDGDYVDPYAKYGYMMSVACAKGKYNVTQCNSAMNYLRGYLNRSVSSFNNVQSTHYLSYLGLNFDIMFPYLTEEDYNLFSQEAHDICQQVSELVNINNDNPSTIQGDNGKGFGAGNALFCYSILGLYPQNPTLIKENSQNLFGKNLYDSWTFRENQFYLAYKNQSSSFYQEHWGYVNYAMPHLGEIVYYRRLNNIDYQNDYNDAFCSIANEYIYSILDKNYNGQIRGDRDQYLKAISWGDSHSYSQVSLAYPVGWSNLEFFAGACNDTNIKKTALWLRELTNIVGDSELSNSYPTLYTYKQIEEDSGLMTSPELLTNKIQYDVTDDIFYLRTNFTYENDTVIIIDGGEERGGGHSQAQGYFLYALGENFIDYEQVPYNDDVRGETWKNGISLQNDTQTHEGQSSFYSATCGNADINQYYGMSDCTKAIYPDDYPNYRRFPITYGGDIENYIGTADANFAGAYVYRPYYNADPVKEYFVKFGDALIKRTTVSGNLQGEGVYHNFISVFNEFDYTKVDNKLIQNRSRNGTNRYMETNLLYDNTSSLNLGGGETNISLCFSKTACTGSTQGNSNYSRDYYYTSQNNVDMIFYHHWYYSGQNLTINSVNYLDDYGASYDNKTVMFDVNGDNVITRNGFSAKGWAGVYDTVNQQYGAFNTTEITKNGVVLINSTEPLTILVDVDNASIVLTVNTMERDTYIDFPRVVNLTLDSVDLVNNTVYNITESDGDQVSYTRDGSLLTFNVLSGQNSDFYTITATGSTGTTTTTTTTTSTSTTTTSSSTTSTTLTSQQTTCENSIGGLLENFSEIAALVSLVVIVFIFTALRNDKVFFKFNTENITKGALTVIVMGLLLAFVIAIIAGMISAC